MIAALTPNPALQALEGRIESLTNELKAADAAMREALMADPDCTLCGGSGIRQIRGGLYGEITTRPCKCAGH